MEEIFWCIKRSYKPAPRVEDGGTSKGPFWWPLLWASLESFVHLMYSIRRCESRTPTKLGFVTICSLRSDSADPLSFSPTRLWWPWKVTPSHSLPLLQRQIPRPFSHFLHSRQTVMAMILKKKKKTLFSFNMDAGNSRFSLASAIILFLAPSFLLRLLQ